MLKIKDFVELGLVLYEYWLLVIKSVVPTHLFQLYYWTVVWALDAVDIINITFMSVVHNFTARFKVSADILNFFRPAPSLCASVSWLFYDMPPNNVMVVFIAELNLYLLCELFAKLCVVHVVHFVFCRVSSVACTEEAVPHWIMLPTSTWNVKLNSLNAPPAKYHDRPNVAVFRKFADVELFYSKEEYKR